jgi:hypothetical protein
MKPRVLLATAVLGIAASFAHAAIQVQFINRGTPASATHTATGYTGYTIRLIETTGAKISAIDFESGTNGLFGPFVQRWTSLDEDGKYTGRTLFNSGANAENLTPSVWNFDSHLLEPGNPKANANIVGLINPEESIGSATFGPIGPNPPFPDNSATAGITVSGINGSLQAAFGIDSSAQSSVLDLAYVVVPDSTGYFGGTALAAVAGGTPQLVLIIWWPEPAALSLLSVGAFAFLARHRRPIR